MIPSRADGEGSCFARHNHPCDRVQAKSASVRDRNEVAAATATYRLLVRELGVALGRDLALALLRTVIVP